MNDLEFANLIARENNARAHGITTNAYTCRDCLAEGRSLNDSTYTDWPDVVDGYTKCARHAGTRGLQPLTIDDLRIIEAKNALTAITDDVRLDIFSLYCFGCGRPDPSCQCENDE